MNKDQSKDLTSYIKNIRNWYHSALTSFTLFQQLMIKKAPNHVGLKTARRNLHTWNEYNGVFTVALTTARYTSIMSLAVLFIDGKDKNGNPSMSLGNLLKEVDENYTVDKAELEVINNKLSSNETIGTLRVLRNQYLAHADKNPDVIEISDAMLEDLIALTKHIVAFGERYILHFDIDDAQYRHNTISGSNVENDVSMSLDKLFTNLQS
ncbi:MAG: hypothetical protein JWO35_668 [Candidatus Saccharibacteria bacterium]|nr:hypothetical protein [Candidatus Saccharibacteria bacterium]